MGKSRSVSSIRSLYEADPRKAYGDLTAPRRDFARRRVKRDPCPALLLDLVAVMTGRVEASLHAALSGPGAERPWL